MKKILQVGPDFTFPLDAVTQTLVVYGGKGMGKTNFAAVLVEELYKHGLKFSVLDPLGVNWGLQHGRNREAAGLTIVILGGVHGDIPIEPTAGAVVADFVADEDVSTVVDISRHANGKMWSFGERIRFVRDYCYRLFERQGERRFPLMQVIDECGRFCPQTIPAGAKDLAECVAAIEQLTEWGRNVAVGVTLITQRSARMNKSVSELAEVMIAFRTVGPRSQAAVMDWLGDHVDKERLKELGDQVRKLKRGTALIVSPGWLEFEGIADVRIRETFDSSKTPEPGVEPRAPGKAAKPDLEAYLARMKDTVERVKAEDPKALQREIVRLKAELKKANTFQTMQKPAPAADEWRPKAEAMAAGYKGLEKRLIDAMKVVGKIGELAASLNGSAQIEVKDNEVVDLLQQLHVKARPAVPAPARHAPPARASIPASDAGDLSKMQRSMLIALAQHPEGLTKAQVLLHTGYASSGSTSDAFAQMNRNGWITTTLNYVKITAEGLSILGDYDPLPQGDELREYLLAGHKLSKMEKALLREICNVYPDPIGKGTVLERAKYASSGSTSDAFARLTRYGYAVSAGAQQLRASEALFD